MSVDWWVGGWMRECVGEWVDHFSLVYFASLLFLTCEKCGNLNIRRFLMSGSLLPPPLSVMPLVTQADRMKEFTVTNYFLILTFSP